MQASAAVFFVLFVSLAASFGWAVRGTTLGSQKGAMLPGAMLGLLLAWFSGNAVIQANFWIFAAVGAAAMYFGGVETYGETLSFVLEKRHPPRFWWGILALVVKGALWWGIAGVLLGMAFTAVIGTVYAVWELLLLFGLMPFVREAGIRLFNRPYQPQEGRFPKIYFSRTRREDWGGLLLILLELLVFTVCKGDTFAWVLCLYGMAAGAVGWVLGINLMHKTSYKLKNGRYLLGKLQENGYVDNWKIMEYTLGAIGGMGIALGFVAQYGRLQQQLAPLAQQGIWQPLGTLAQPLGWGLLALLVAGDVIGALWGLRRDKQGKDDRPVDIFMDVRYLYLSLPLLLMGAVEFAQWYAVFLVFWVLAEKLLCGKLGKGRHVPWYAGVTLLLTAGLFMAQLVLPQRFGVFTTWVLYCTVYFLAQLLLVDFNPEQCQKRRAAGNGRQMLRTFGGLVMSEGCKAVMILLLLCLGARVLR